MRCVFIFFSRIFILVSLSLQTSRAAVEFSPFLISAPAEQITTRGQNRQALFISDQEILFISRDRKRDQDPQLYKKNLNSGDEIQTTYQRGTIQIGAILHDKKQILFSSSSDEDNESPLALKKYLDRFPSSVDQGGFVYVDFNPQEIYLSTFDGSKITRLTQWSGFDGFPAYKKQGNQIYFSRFSNKQLRLYTMQNEEDAKAWPVIKTDGHDLGVQVSPQSNSFVWSRFSSDFQTSQIFASNSVFKKTKILTPDFDLSWSPSFHPDGQSVIFSARNKEMANLDLFEVTVDGKCHRQLSSYEGDEYFPTVSPDGTKIMFTSTQSGSEQIFMIQYPGPLKCGTPDSI